MREQSVGSRSRGRRAAGVLACTPGNVRTRTAFRLLAGTFVLLGVLATGCSSNNEGPAIVGGGVAVPPPAPNATTATDPNAPLTLFEQRRLLNRIAADPRQLQRMSLRERRGLAAIAATLEKNDEDEN